jgi:hypothetical protein
LPAPLLRFAGWSLVPYAAALVFVAGRATPSRGAVVAVIALNAAWVAASLLVLAAGALRPGPLGYAFVIAQAVAVALLAEMETVGLRRA